MAKNIDPNAKMANDIFDQKFLYPKRAFWSNGIFGQITNSANRLLHRSMSISAKRHFRSNGSFCKTTVLAKRHFRAKELFSWTSFSAECPFKQDVLVRSNDIFSQTALPRSKIWFKRKIIGICMKNYLKLKRDFVVFIIKNCSPRLAQLIFRRNVSIEKIENWILSLLEAAADLSSIDPQSSCIIF